MPSIKTDQDARRPSDVRPPEIEASQIRALHGAMIDIVSVMNRPKRDEMMVREAGISLDGALFPLLVGIERRGPIGVVDLADRVGRDYTTVSRQVAKLESLGLIKRQKGQADRRVREARVTPLGQAMTDAVDAARERIGRATFAAWDTRDIEDLIRLTRKFADALNDDRGAGPNSGNINPDQSQPEAESPQPPDEATPPASLSTVVL